MRGLSVVVPAAAFALLLLALACGRKGPPLPPLPGMKPAVSDLALGQVGLEVHARFSLPVRPEREVVDYRVLAAELWRRPAEEGQEPEDGLAFGAFRKDAVLLDIATGDELARQAATGGPALIDRLTPDVVGAGPQEYAVLLKTSASQRGRLSNIVVFEPHPPPEPPSDLVAELREGAISLSFLPPEDVGPSDVEEPAEDPGASPGDAETSPEGAVEEDVEEDGEDEAEAAAPGLTFSVHRAEEEQAFGVDPLNDRPLARPEYVDRDVRLGTTYRYHVRSISERDGVPVQSAASSPVSIRYEDVFAPATPHGLRLIPQGRRAVNLIWNPNTEVDLRGYAVWRRQEGGEWVRLDAGTARTATFTDRSVAPGQRYEYSVSAFDAAEPPNQSDRSAPQAILIPGAGGPAAPDPR